jgi:parallel beta-helix repeat protein
VNNNTIAGNAWDGVDVDTAQYTTIEDNLILANGDDGIDFDDTSYNTVTRNNITNNHDDGVNLDNSYTVSIVENLVADNTRYGLEIVNSSGNKIYYNNFVNNPQHVFIEDSINDWNTTYFSLINGIQTIGGNYWDNYADHHEGEDSDIFGGPNQDESGGDGVWDSPYIIDGTNQDNYPRTSLFIREHEEPDQPQQYVLTVHVDDEDTQANISGATVSVYFSNETLAEVSTTTDGVATFSLIEGSYYIVVQFAGYEEDEGSQFLLTGDKMQDVSMARSTEDQAGVNWPLYGAIGAGGVAGFLVLFVLFKRKKKYECKICDLEFDSEEELRKHNEEKH